MHGRGAGVYWQRLWYMVSGTKCGTSVQYSPLFVRIIRESGTLIQKVL